MNDSEKPALVYAAFKGNIYVQFLFAELNLNLFQGLLLQWSCLFEMELMSTS